MKCCKTHFTKRYAGKASILAAISLAICACKVGPNYQRPDMKMPVGYREQPATQPTQTQPATKQATTVPSLNRWWKLFNDPELTRLEEAATINNPQLKAAMARVDQARAAAGITRSDLYPTVTVDPSVQRGRSISRTGSSTRGRTATTVSLPVDVSYEVDIWGRVRRQVEASNAQVVSSENAMGVILLTLQSDLALNYFNLRSLDQQDDILAHMIQLLQQEMTLLERQRKVGIINDLAIVQTRAQIEAEVSQQAEVRRQRANAEHAIAILTGLPPSELQLAKAQYAFQVPAVPPGLPSDLLRQRPDVAEAEQDLVTANAQVGVAKANFLPVVRLTGAAGFESADLRTAVDWENRVWSLGPSVSIPIFEGGRLTAALQQAKARYEELVHTYRNTVITALGEVEDSLSDLRLRSEAGAAQARAVAASREYLRLSQIQYNAGTVTFLVVIDANRTLLTNEISALQIESQRSIATVALIKALGGDWTQEQRELAQAAPESKREK